jgi:hypothetical protein
MNAVRPIDDGLWFGEACHTGEIKRRYNVLAAGWRLKEVSRFASGAKAKVYNFCTSFEQIRRQRLNDLRYENALLARVVFETVTEVARLRRVLAG